MKFYKQLLLGASLVTIVFLLAAAVRENFFAEWRGWQKAYRKALRERAQNPAERQEALDYEIKPRQVVLPQLMVIDRCVSCHVGIEDPRMTGRPNPLRFHPGDYLKHHPVERFGCTACHRGQGRALVFAEAKAEGYHWDYPLLPKRFSAAACSACHDPAALTGRGAEERAAAVKIFIRQGCHGCHKLEGRGGGVGPALDNEGLRRISQLPMAHLRGPKNQWNWLAEHFDDPQRVFPGSQMPRPPVGPREQEELTLYMLSLEERVLPNNYIPKDRYALLYRRTQPAKAKADGPALYVEFCGACHGPQGQGRHLAEWGATFPAVSGTEFLAIASDGYLQETVARGRRGRPMPAWREEGGLTEQEITVLSAYLRSAAAKPLSYATVMAAPANPAGGAEIFRQRCSTCHTPQGAPALGPNLFRPNLRKYGGAAFIFQTLMHGRPDTAMGVFPDLGPAEVRGVIAYLLSAPPVASSPFRPKGVEEPKVLTQQNPYEKTCAPCHGARGEGGGGPALAGPAWQRLASNEFIRAEVQTCIERENLSGVSATEMVSVIRTLGKNAPLRLKGRMAGSADAGSKLYAFTCAGCHGKQGEGDLGPALANQDFLTAATDGFMAATIVRGRGSTSMRAFGLSSYGLPALSGADVRNLVAHLRSWQQAKPSAEVK